MKYRLIYSYNMIECFANLFRVKIAMKKYGNLSTKSSRTTEYAF